MEKTGMNWNAMSPIEIINALSPMHRSKVYLIIRDELDKTDITSLMGSDVGTKQKFQELKLEAKQSWEHDHKMATMMDVDRACTVLYTMVLKLMNASNTDVNRELGRVFGAINKIEEKLGLPLTSYDDTMRTVNDGGILNDDVKSNPPDSN